ncbi:hypothetical protein [Enterococcus sp. AZ072]|uniref:hypothetical protein n=1 Tax=unclassified Enterococcus TaxID=2608891 RepID=UPI003D2E7C95
MTKLYEIQFIDEVSVQQELANLLENSIDVIQETRKALLVAAYQVQERRRLTNHIFKEHQVIQVQENDLLWAYYCPEKTKNHRTAFRSFLVKQRYHRKNKMILVVHPTYEQSKQWFDLNQL